VRALFTAAGDRRDIDIVRQGEIIGDAFDRIVLFEDACNRGRREGEVVDLLRQGVSRGRRVSEVHELHGEERAIELCLRQLMPGDMLLVQVDQMESSIAFIDRFIATERPTVVQSSYALTDAVNELGRKRAAVG
jgi:cyanophycin synthetase